jgi:Ca2+-transporting ATPase
MAVQDVGQRLGVSTEGLSTAEASDRLAKYGPNTLRKVKEEPFWEELLEEAGEPMIILLFVTGVFYAIIGGLEDALVILAVILILLGVEVLNEYRAGKAIVALRRLAEPVGLVRREGKYLEVQVEKVVPGDLVLLQSGRRVPVDARLVEAYGIAVDESLLTGESGPVEKSAAAPLPDATPLAEKIGTAHG